MYGAVDSSSVGPEDSRSEFNATSSSITRVEEPSESKSPTPGAVSNDDSKPLLSPGHHDPEGKPKTKKKKKSRANLPKDEPAPRSPMMEGYLWGQIANVAKIGVWWVTFSPLVLALFAGDALAIGFSRIAFNLALFVFSPLAGSLMEGWTVRSVLNVSTVIRGLIYIVLLPLSWMLLRTNYIIDIDTESVTYDRVFFFIFLGLVLADGIVVAFSNIVDVDCGGADLLANQHKVRIDDETRNRYNSLHVVFFEGSMVLLAPSVGALALLVDYKVRDHDKLIMVSLLGVIYFFFSIVSLYFYNAWIPTVKVTRENEGPRVPEHYLREIMSSLYEGMSLTWRFKPIFWRLIFLGLETAFEDAVISIIIPEYALFVLGKRSTKRNYVIGTFWACVLAAIAKVGSVFTSYIMTKSWRPPIHSGDDDEEEYEEERRSYAQFFKYFCFSGVSILLLPLAYYVENQGSYWGSAVIAFVGCFLFFTFSTAPKIAFQSLLQSLSNDADPSGRLYGFIGTFVTLLDSLILLGYSFIFAYASLEVALIISTGIITAHGISELVLGPCLVLPSSYKHKDGYGRIQN